MKKFMMTTLVAGLFSAYGAVAADTDRVDITWLGVEQYKDINPAEESAAHFNKRMFSSIERQFEILAKKLPEGYTMKVVISDVDLAGRVLPANRGNLRLIRVIEEHFKPSITLSYEVFNAKGESVVASDTVELDGKLTYRAPRPQHMQREFAYDNYLIKKWFKESLLPLVTKNS